VYSYFESRQGALFDKTVFFGLQYFMKEYLEGIVVTQEKIDKAEKLSNQHFGNNYFNRKGWEYILNNHGGKLPVRIRAVPEGMPVPVSNVMMVIENLDPKNCFFLSSHLETMLTHNWSPSTVATVSYVTKQIIKKYLDKSADSDAGLDFMLHDFGFRGRFIIGDRCNCRSRSLN